MNAPVWLTVSACVGAVRHSVCVYGGLYDVVLMHECLPVNTCVGLHVWDAAYVWIAGCEGLYVSAYGWGHINEGICLSVYVCMCVCANSTCV